MYVCMNGRVSAGVKSGCMLCGDAHVKGEERKKSPLILYVSSLLGVLFYIQGKNRHQGTVLLFLFVASCSWQRKKKT